jgi:hypothetical protein
MKAHGKPFGPFRATRRGCEFDHYPVCRKSIGGSAAAAAKAVASNKTVAATEEREENRRLAAAWLCRCEVLTGGILN